MMRATRVALLTLALAACAPVATLRPSAAEIAAPAAWRTPLRAEAPIDRDWWRRFDDPVLTSLVDQARAHNPDIAIAILRVNEARAQERIARAALLPTVDVAAAGSSSRALAPIGQPVETSALQPLVQVSYELDLFGRAASQIAASRASTAAFQSSRETVLLSVSAATVTGYVTLLALDGRLQVLRATLASRSEALRYARSRAEAGYTSDLEFRLAQAEYKATEQQIPAAELAVSRQENALSVLIGAKPAAITRGRTLERLRVPPTPAGLPSELTRRRPDIAAAEFNLAAGDAQIAVARAQFLPQIRLTASAGAIVSSLAADPVSVFLLGGSVLAPLFRGGQLTGTFDAAVSRRDQAAFSYQRTILNAFREVEDAMAAVDRLDAQQRALAEQRLATAEALRHATNRYEAGYSPYIEQLDAQRSLLSVDLAIVQVRADRLSAITALYQALGGGWNDPTLASPR